MQKNKLGWIILIATVLWLSTAGITPVFAQPPMSSKYYCLLDGASGQILMSKNADTIRPVASTTKMMTAIVTLDYSSLNEVAVVSRKADRTHEYTIGLSEGQKLPVAELLKAALICSANDAAVVLAEHVAGDEALFGHLMSLKSFIIGATATHFVNASGLPAADHYSTALDLAQIGRYALTYPSIKQIVGTAQAEFHHPAYKEPLVIRNTNHLLNDYQGTIGIKTGTTDAAGKCLVAAAARKGRQLIAVVLKSADRQGDCRRLLDYGFYHYSYCKIIDKNDSFKRIQVIGGKPSYADVYPAQDLWLWVDDHQPNLEKQVTINYSIPAPVHRGEKVGELSVYVEGKLVENIALIIPKPINRDYLSITRIYQRFFK